MIIKKKIISIIPSIELQSVKLMLKVKKKKLILFYIYQMLDKVNTIFIKHW